MEDLKQILPSLIPLFQSFLWVILIISLVFYFRRDIQLLRDELRRRIKSGESFELGPLKLIENKVKDVEKEVNVTKQFLLSMGPAMYFNLKKIASGNFGHYEIKEWSGLKRELYYLRDIGYIQVDSISKLPEEGGNLSDYVQITDIGKKFVELRQSVLNSNNISSNL